MFVGTYVCLERGRQWVICTDGHFNRLCLAGGHYYICTSVGKKNMYGCEARDECDDGVHVNVPRYVQVTYYM